MRFGHGWWPPRPFAKRPWSGLRTRLALLLIGARARTDCVSNIGQLRQVYSAMILGGDGERGLRSRLYGNGRALMPSMLPLLYPRENLVISDRSFDAETTAIIGEAFDKACKEMHDQTQPDSLQESIAGRLIDIAARGERDPKKMCESAGRRTQPRPAASEPGSGRPAARWPEPGRSAESRRP